LIRPYALQAKAALGITCDDSRQPEPGVLVVRVTLNRLGQQFGGLGLITAFECGNTLLDKLIGGCNRGRR
jgi:hypothetical protein